MHSTIFREFISSTFHSKPRRIAWLTYLLGCRLFPVFFLAACSSTETSDSRKEAYFLHIQAIRVHKRVVTMLDSARAQPGQNLKLDSLSRALQDWEDRLIEVPGFENHGSHAGHVHHHQAPAADFSPEQMRDIQREFLRVITDIETLLIYASKKQGQELTEK